MTPDRLPAAPVIPTTNVNGAHQATRRVFLRGAATLGLAVGAAGLMSQRIGAQDHAHDAATPDTTDPDSSYV